MLKAIILAAGKGERMKSKVPKVLHKVMDKMMIDYVLKAAKQAGAINNIVIVGHQSAMVKAKIGEQADRFVLQKEQLGTGHAVMQAEDYIEDNDSVLILCGDTPLIETNTLKEFVKWHNDKENAVTVLSVDMENPFGYGRIIRDGEGLLKISEHKDCNEEELKVNEINTGVYVFNGKILKEALKKISNNNSQGEYYLTDAVEIIKNNKMGNTGVYKAKDSDEFMGINSKLQLSYANEIMKKRINEYHMLNGVTIEDPSNTYISADAVIAADTVIMPGTVIQGETEIGTDCIIGPNARINNCIIKDGVIIDNSTLLNSYVDNYTTVGPYAYVRPNSKIGEHVKIGDFVEIKNSTIDDGTKVSHLTYVGDSDVGKSVNFGCGTVTVNYDGKNKFRTKIGDHAFIGCNTNLVAPVVVNEGAFTAAGSTITDDVPAGSLSIARSKQINKIGWAETKNK